MTTPFLLLAVAGTVLLLVALRRRAGQRRLDEAARRTELLARDGQEALAKVLRVDPTGRVVRRTAVECHIRFEVQPLPAGTAFTGHRLLLLALDQIPSENDVWPAFFDPADPGSFRVTVPQQP